MKYFAYGMNTNLDEMARRCPGAKNLGLSWIDDYELCFRTYCDIEHKPGTRTYGVLWEIDLDNLRALDMLEGYPHYYSRFNVRVDQEAAWHTALVYQMNDQHLLAAPSWHYLDCVRDGYSCNAVPQSQIDDAINNVSCYLSAQTKPESSIIW